VDDVSEEGGMKRVDKRLEVGESLESSNKSLQSLRIRVRSSRCKGVVLGDSRGV